MSMHSQRRWRLWNSLSRTRAKKDRFDLGSGDSSGGELELRYALPLSFRGPRLKAVGVRVAMDDIGVRLVVDEVGARVAVGEVGARVAMGEGILSSSESGEPSPNAPRSLLKDESVEVERRGGAVLLVYSSGIGTCSLGSYRVRTFPLAIMRTVDSRSSRKAATLGVFRFEYGLRRDHSILYTCRILT